jgi:hypothetical protein
LDPIFEAAFNLQPIEGLQSEIAAGGSAESHNAYLIRRLPVV